MKRMTSRERRAEERRILAEMDEAMQEQAVQKQETGEETAGKDVKTKKTVKTTKKQDDSMPSTLHCKRCKTVMENGVCPACGFKVYVPMDEEKRKKIKLALTVVGFVVFIIIFVALQFKKA